jgi:multiple sugar transport system permease protein
MTRGGREQGTDATSCASAGRARAAGFAFVAPALGLLVALNVFPLIYNIRLSFTDATLSGTSRAFVGWDNYRRVFERSSDNRYARAIRTTAAYTACAVSAELALGFLLALACRGRFPGRPLAVTFLLLPMMLSPAVMGLYWSLIFNEQFGVLNRLLSLLGVAHPPAWLTGPRVKLSSALLIDVWMWTPFMMLIAMAALNSIPAYIYEAAAIDRAGPWTVFRRITLPMSAPLLLLAALLRTTDALKQFDFVMALTGPNDAATQTLSALLYQVLVRNGRTGLGSAYACVVLVAVIALATAFVRYMDALRARQGRTGGGA